MSSGILARAWLPRAPKPFVMQSLVLVQVKSRGLAFVGNKKSQQQPQGRTSKKPGEGRDPYALLKEAMLSEPDPKLLEELAEKKVPWVEHQEHKRKYSQIMMREVSTIAFAVPLTRLSSTRLRVLLHRTSE